MVTALDPAGHFAPLPPAEYDFDQLARWLKTQDVQVRSVTGANITGSTITGSTITGTTIQTAATGERVVLGETDSYITFYDSGGLLGYVGAELTGWGSSWLTIQTPANIDGIAIDAHGLLKLEADGASGESVWISGKANGGLPGEVLGIYDSYTPAQVASFGTAGLGTSWIWIGNQTTAAKYTDTMWLTAQNINLQVWDNAATPTTLYDSVKLTDPLITFYTDDEIQVQFADASYQFGAYQGTAGLEVGSLQGTIGTYSAFIDFHTGGSQDRNARIIASGGSGAYNGNASLAIHSGSFGHVVATTTGTTTTNMVLDEGGMYIYGADPYTNAQAWLSITPVATGGSYDDQMGGISIGESGKHGAASIHLVYTGDGYGHLGMGAVSYAASPIAYRFLRMKYNSQEVYMNWSLAYVEDMHYDATAYGVVRVNTGGAGTNARLSQNSYSSKREYKRDIKTHRLEDSPFLGLRPVTYRYRNHPDLAFIDALDKREKKYGLILEEALEAGMATKRIEYHPVTGEPHGIYYDSYIEELVADHIALVQEVLDLKKKVMELAA